MINWYNYEIYKPLVGVDILVWYRGTPCRGMYERHDKKWIWWVTYFDEELKAGWTTRPVQECEVNWWAGINAPE